jgi:hypothetical protein
MPPVERGSSSSSLDVRSEMESVKGEHHDNNNSPRLDKGLEEFHINVRYLKW